MSLIAKMAPKIYYSSWVSFSGKDLDLGPQTSGVFYLGLMFLFAGTPMKKFLFLLVKIKAEKETPQSTHRKGGRLGGKEYFFLHVGTRNKKPKT